MSILSANLKHLYQRRSFWILGLFLGFVAVVFIMLMTEAASKNKQGVFCAPAFWMLLVGSFLAALQVEILTKPFSCCLPGHRYIPRKFLFWTGLPLSFLWSLGFLLFPDLNFVQTLLACLSAFATFTIFYWLGVWLVFRFRYWIFVFPLFPLLLLGDMTLNITLFMVHTIVEKPLLIILSGGLVNFLAWWHWGRPDLARSYCGQLWMGTFDFWNMEKAVKLSRARLAEMDKKKPGSKRMIISSGVEKFFISRISRAESGSVGQYIWGGLYKSFGIMLSQKWWIGILFFTIPLPILCFPCYMPGSGDVGGKNIIFLMPGMMVVLMNLWVYSSWLVAGGRRQRFWVALTLAAAASILITLLVTVFAALTMLIELILPAVTIKNQTFVFHALNIQLFFVPLLIIPFALTIRLILHAKPVLLILIITLFFGLLGGSADFLQHHLSVIYPVVPVIIPILLGAAWAVFIAVLRYICQHCCLVNQTR